jgi:hypothetical protein
MAVRFSTAEVGRRSQLDYWWEVVCATFLALDVERGVPGPREYRRHPGSGRPRGQRIAPAGTGAANGQDWA